MSIGLAIALVSRYLPAEASGLAAGAAGLVLKNVPSAQRPSISSSVGATSGAYHCQTGEGIRNSSADELRQHLGLGDE